MAEERESAPLLQQVLEKSTGKPGAMVISLVATTGIAAAPREQQLQQTVWDTPTVANPWGVTACLLLGECRAGLPLPRRAWGA
jgi:hypothetical protein